MNKDMCKFLTNLLLITASIIFVILLMLLSGIFIIGYQNEKDDYMASLIDKVKRLKSINVPKIILVGNSNLSFGMDSKMLEEAVNMPVVNLGLHGGLGNEFHENIAKLNINSGDIVIICHSTYSDDSRIDDIELSWHTLEYHKDLWEILKPEEYFDMAIAFPKYWRKSIQKIIKRINLPENLETAYSRKAFNKYGDVAIKPDSGIQDEDEIFWSGREKAPQVNDICTNRLNELNKYANKKGATLLIAGYPISHGKYSPPDEEYEKFQAKLKEKLDCEIISDFRDYFMPYPCFYDFTLHLNKEGTRIRTQQLIKDIKRWQSSKE